jgi:hypothetical protein
MSYEVILRPRAEADLVALPPDLQPFVAHHLDLLGRSPASLSRSAVSPPYPAGSQMYEFDQDFDGATFHHFVSFFRYGQDEATLYVLGIGHVAHRRGF